MVKSKYWRALVFCVWIGLSCTKIDTTSIGRDLIPVVDNITTFDTVLSVIANNRLVTDTTRLFAADPHPAGALADDPLFGSSRATMFFETKPGTFTFSFGNKDSIANGFDSAVMIIEYAGVYGDTATPLNFRLYEVDRKMQPDTLQIPEYTLNPNLGVNRSRFWGSKSMAANKYKDTIEIRRGNKDTVYEKVVNQLRIPLNPTLASALFYQDTLGAFKSDSAFKEFLPGFALEVEGNPNALHYFKTFGGSTRLQFYYRIKNPGGLDTTSSSFAMTGLSGHAVKLERQRNGAEVSNFLAQNPTEGVPNIYIQSAPGIDASIIIPGLAGMSNRVVHRAELRVTQISPDPPLYSQLTPPTLLYLDIQEGEENSFRGVPYDLSPFSPYFCYPASGIEYAYFGGPTAYETIDGERHAIYRFNLSRYVQNIFTKGDPVYKLRLSAPYYHIYQNCVNPDITQPANYFFAKINNTIANLPGRGRVRVAGGNHPNPKLRMQLRIIYSNI